MKMEVESKGKEREAAVEDDDERQSSGSRSSRFFTIHAIQLTFF